MQLAPNGTILVVDDEEGIRSVIVAILDSLDIKTLEASSAQSAIAVFEANQEKIAACMLDMNLDDCHGEELYDQLRKRSDDLPIFAMSGIYGEEIRERLGSRKIAGLIAKPFSAGELIKTLQTGLSVAE